MNRYQRKWMKYTAFFVLSAAVGFVATAIILGWLFQGATEESGARFLYRFLLLVTWPLFTYGAYALGSDWVNELRAEREHAEFLSAKAREKAAHEHAKRVAIEEQRDAERLRREAYEARRGQVESLIEKWEDD